MPAALPFEIGLLTPGVEAVWRRLWRDDLECYQAALPEEAHATTVARLLAGGPKEFRGLLAVHDGNVFALVRCLFNRSSWAVGTVCYLQNLFTLPEARGRGIGRAIIEAVHAESDWAGTPDIYWLTQERTATARSLYDRNGTRTLFFARERTA